MIEHTFCLCHKVAGLGSRIPIIEQEQAKYSDTHTPSSSMRVPSTCPGVRLQALPYTNNNLAKSDLLAQRYPVLGEGKVIPLTKAVRTPLCFWLILTNGKIQLCIKLQIPLQVFQKKNNHRFSMLHVNATKNGNLHIVWVETTATNYTEIRCWQIQFLRPGGRRNYCTTGASPLHRAKCQWQRDRQWQLQPMSVIQLYSVVIAHRTDTTR